MIRGALWLLLAIVISACAGSGSTRVTAGADVGGGAGTSGAAGSSAGAGLPAAAGSSTDASTAPEQAIANHGPTGWNRGPYDLAGGNYRLDWESDGTCSALYFGIVGLNNGVREAPPTAGDVALQDMLKGSRTIAGVPAGSYYFNVSGVACKRYSATLTRQ